MKVLAVGAQKGGVGKTTTALYLAARAAETLGSTPERPMVGIVDRDESRNLHAVLDIRPEALVPGVVLLQGTDLHQASGLELVILDTPPGLSAIDSLYEAHLVVIPVMPEDQGVANFSAYLRNIEHHRVMNNPALRLVAAIPTMVERNAMHRSLLPVIAQIAARHRPPLAVLPAIPRLMRIKRFEMDAPDYDAAAKELFDHAHLVPIAPRP